MKERDSFLWLENDVEVFIAGPDCYYEPQLNVLGTVYEVFYIWHDALRPSSFFGRRIEPSVGWTLNAHGVYDSHLPECFPRIIFSAKKINY
jgi:hypothetical protein